MKSIIRLAFMIFALLLAFFVQACDLGTQGRLFAALILACAFLLLLIDTQKSIMKSESIHVKNGHPVGRPDLQLDNKYPKPGPFISASALNAVAMGARNVNSAMSTIDELRQQLADVSHERDLLRAQLSTPTPAQMLEIGANYWEGRRNVARDSGAVKWVKNPETGALLIYTRGEYAGVLMDAVMGIEGSESAEGGNHEHE